VSLPPFINDLFQRELSLDARLGVLEDYLKSSGWAARPRPRWLAFFGVSMASTLTKTVWLSPEAEISVANRVFALSHEATHVHRQMSFPGGRFVWLALYFGLNVLPLILPFVLLPVRLDWLGYAITIALLAMLNGWFRAKEEAVAAATDRILKWRCGYSAESIVERADHIGGFSPPYFTAVPSSLVDTWIFEAENRLLEFISSQPD